MTANIPDVLDLSGAAWYKSSYSDGGNGCIETAPNFPGLAPVRDSKNPDGPALVFTRAAFAAFVTATVAGEFGTV